MIPNETRLFLENWFDAALSPGTKIISENPLSGGSINEAFSLQTSSGNFFLKFNAADRYPAMFMKEARGLEILKTAGCISVPKVLLTAETGRFSFLLLELISGNKPVENFFMFFGSQLAALHKQSADKFGLDHDNYIGSLCQSNTFHGNWIDFLINERLQPLLEMAVNLGLLNMRDSGMFERLYTRFPGLLPVEPPALLHGDLWSGNYMTGNDGLPCLFDPAVYFGHREMDIAMTKLFGGFSPEFYHSYNNTYPMEPGWENRIAINQLYPLLMHVNLFGGGYAGQVRQIVGVF